MWTSAWSACLFSCFRSVRHIDGVQNVPASNALLANRRESGETGMKEKDCFLAAPSSEGSHPPASRGHNAPSLRSRIAFLPQVRSAGSPLIAAKLSSLQNIWQLRCPVSVEVRGEEAWTPPNTLGRILARVL